MATTPEGKVKAAIKAFLKTLPRCWFFMPVSNGMGTMGIPDIICCYRGVFLAIECKAPGKVANTTPLQMAQITGIRDAQGHALVVDSVDTLKVYLKFIDSAYM